MKRFKIDAFEARGHNDTTEGKGGTHRIGLFSSSLEAHKASLGAGVMGGAGVVKKVDEDIIIWDSVAERDKYNQKQKVIDTIANMTESQIETLRQYFYEEIRSEQAATN